MATPAEARREAAEEGKDVTPRMGDNNKVTRVVWTDKGPKEVEFDIIDNTPQPVKVDTK